MVLTCKLVACHRMETCRYLHWMVEDPLMAKESTPKAFRQVTKPVSGFGVNDHGASQLM